MDARDRLIPFIEYRIPGYQAARHHRFIANRLEAVEAGSIKRLMIFCPPGSAKSTYGSVEFPAWYVGKNPTKSLLGIGHSGDLAEGFGRRVRNIVGGAEFRAVFEGVSLSADSQAAGRWQTNRGGEYFAVGVGGAIAGHRGDGALIDDPIKGWEEAHSAPAREKVWQVYLADIRPRLKPDAFIVLIQTRWHDDDLAGRILPADYDGRSGWVTARDGEEWMVISLPAIAEESDVLGREPGEILWPEWFSREMFEQERKTQGPRSFSALYQQRPLPESGKYFERDWFKYYEKAPTNLRVYGASDYAVTEDGGDFTVHLVVGVDPNDDIYLLDLWRQQASSLAWVEAWCDLVLLWRPLDWAEESGQIEKGVGPFLKKRALERKAYCVRTAFVSSMQKDARAQSIRARVEMGKVFFPRNAPWINAFTFELLRFGASSIDDQVDCLSLIGRMLDTMERAQAPIVPKPQKTLQEMSLDELIAASKTHNSKGRI